MHIDLKLFNFIFSFFLNLIDLKLFNFILKLFYFVSRFVSPLCFPVVVQRYSTPGGRVQVLELVFPLTRARARVSGKNELEDLDQAGYGSKSSSQPLSGRSPRASRSYYFFSIVATMSTQI